MLIHRVLYYYDTFLNHLYTWCKKPLLGNVGKGTVIRRHVKFEGDCLKNVIIGSNCDIDTYSVIGSRRRLEVNNTLIKPYLKIGNGCTIGQYNHITAVNHIEIGNNLLTGRFVLISDNSHSGNCRSELDLHPSLRHVVSKGEIVIGNNVWLGDKVSILAGVHIGDGCIIGANSVVTHDIPAYSIAAGVPAKVIKWFEH